MLDEEDDEPSRAAPDWTLTYGDMMSLLLTLFVMLVSMSEIKQNDKFQGVADSLHSQFGYSTPAGHRPGELRARNPGIAAIAVAGRAARSAALASRDGGDRESSAAVSFEAGGRDLSPTAKDDLQRLAANVLRRSAAGQRVEVRAIFAPGGSKDDLDLAWQRASATQGYLTGELGVASERVRLAVTPADAPPSAGNTATTGPTSAATEKPMVEVVVLR